MKTKQASILLVEDDEVDVKAIKRSFKKRNLANPLVIASDGVEALEILRSKSEKKIHPPYLVLLDLNMPRMGGIEFLEELRGDDKLKPTVVFVLTTSDDNTDKLNAYKLNVAGYLLKNDAGEGLLSHVSMLDKYLVSVEFLVDSDRY